MESYNIGLPILHVFNITNKHERMPSLLEKDSNLYKVKESYNKDLFIN